MVMSMGYAPHLIARGRAERPQGGVAVLTPVHVPRVLQDRVACDAEV
jgi:hypothetical protein